METEFQEDNKSNSSDICIIDNTDLDNFSQIKYTNDHEKFQNILQETENEKRLKEENEKANKRNLRSMKNNVTKERNCFGVDQT